MSESGSRDKEKLQHENKELIDTTKALIRLYKSAFGEIWREAFQATVKVAL